MKKRINAHVWHNEPFSPRNFPQVLQQTVLAFLRERVAAEASYLELRPPRWKEEGGELLSALCAGILPIKVRGDWWSVSGLVWREHRCRVYLELSPPNAL